VKYPVRASKVDVFRTSLLLLLLLRLLLLLLLLLLQTLYFL
jgi:hypothetical protein